MPDKQVDLVMRRLLHDHRAFVDSIPPGDVRDLLDGSGSSLLDLREAVSMMIESPDYTKLTVGGYLALMSLIELWMHDDEPVVGTIIECARDLIAQVDEMTNGDQNRC